MTSPLSILTDALIDYAGLFPPASLPMDQAVRNYDAYRHGEHRRMLARFIVPVHRLDEFERAASSRLDEDPDPWHLSLLGTDDPRSDAEAMRRFNERHNGGAVIDVLETRLGALKAIPDPRDLFAGAQIYVEIPADSPELSEQIESLRRGGLRAKIRMGGVTAAMFPDAEAVIDFFTACIERRVSLKATAGLHHPLRCRAALSYEPDSESGMMYGFVNLFLAAAFAYERRSRDEIRALLLESDPSAFSISDHAITWRGQELLSEVIAEVRRNVAIAFGSCSFEEPVNDLISLGWLSGQSMESSRT